MMDPATELVPFLTDPTGREHLLIDQTITVGRAVENDIVITSRRVSREHARLQREGWRVILEDQGSTNGTYLNQERVLAPVALRDGDVGAGVVRVDRQLLHLSAKEFALLSYLYDHRGQVCSKDDIGIAVWPEYDGGVYDYQIENLVRRLRQQLEPDPSEPQLLVTARGLGYKLVAQG
jgi:hypothetical protein